MKATQNACALKLWQDIGRLITVTSVKIVFGTVIALSSSSTSISGNSTVCIEVIPERGANVTRSTKGVGVSEDKILNIRKLIAATLNIPLTDVRLRAQSTVPQDGPKFRFSINGFVQETEVPANRVAVSQGDSMWSRKGGGYFLQHIIQFQAVSELISYDATVELSNGVTQLKSVDFSTGTRLCGS